MENIGRTVSIELEYAKEHCIPVLPIVEETVSEEDYREVFGTIQYLYEQACDVTTLSFEEKLEKYLHSVLVSNEVMMQIKEEFEGQIFLSYRKKDRQYAQELMKLIHSVDFTRDLSIWYDENIKLGERFDEEIMEAIVKSQLFALCVTPNLVKEPNYVLSTELPKAFEMEMPVVAVEMQKTDYNLLPEFRPDDCYVMERDMKHLEAAITKSFSYLKSKEETTNRNIFI